MPLTSFYTNTLPNNDTNAVWASASTYTYASDVTINSVLHHVYSRGVAANDIKVNTVTDVWSDHGFDHPETTNDVGVFTESNGNVILYYPDETSTTVLYQFAKPSGTSTEGYSYSGTLTVNGTSLEYDIPATSSSGTYELKADGITQLSIVHGSTASTGSAPNFDQTKIWTLISPMGDELDEIDLTGSGVSLTKKVFCNFW